MITGDDDWEQHDAEERSSTRAEFPVEHICNFFRSVAPIRSELTQIHRLQPPSSHTSSIRPPGSPSPVASLFPLNPPIPSFLPRPPAPFPSSANPTLCRPRKPRSPRLRQKRNRKFCCDDPRVSLPFPPASTRNRGGESPRRGNLCRADLARPLLVFPSRRVGARKSSQTESRRSRHWRRCTGRVDRWSAVRWRRPRWGYSELRQRSLTRILEWLSRRNYSSSPTSSWRGVSCCCAVIPFVRVVITVLFSSPAQVATSVLR